HQMMSVVAHLQCIYIAYLCICLFTDSFIFIFIDFVFRTKLTLYSLEDAFMMRKGDDSVFGKHACPPYVCPESLQEEANYSGKAADNILNSKIQRCKFRLPDTLASRARCLIQNILQLDPSKCLTAQEILDNPWFSYDDQIVPDLSYITDSKT
uniref:Protein kinase domain-containing protein n=1 Tax=Electrophorus electricus TaxID=8005 RepID=A0A4W4F7S3_ELEEL